MLSGMWSSGVRKLRKILEETGLNSRRMLTLGDGRVKDTYNLLLHYFLGICV